VYTPYALQHFRYQKRCQKRNQPAPPCQSNRRPWRRPHSPVHLCIYSLELKAGIAYMYFYRTSLTLKIIPQVCLRCPITAYSGVVDVRCLLAPESEMLLGVKTHSRW